MYPTFVDRFSHQFVLNPLAPHPLQMWLCRLVSDLYGWKRGKSADNGHHEDDVVRDLFLDLHKEMVSATDLQEKVDLLDELALAARFDVNLKRLTLLQV